MEAFLQADPIIDWQHPAILALAEEIAAAHAGADNQEIAIARASFEWVRDRIYHSGDDQMNPITCSASQVLEHQTGFCFAKSHLLAAILRANGIPAGFCYQRLSLDNRGAPYSLHGFNAIYLNEFGWYRVDPRGNRDFVGKNNQDALNRVAILRLRIDAQFTPPHEQLAYTPQITGEADFENILASPLPIVVQVLQTHRTLAELCANFPDLEPDNVSTCDRTSANLFTSNLSGLLG
ncbi:transglutaminase domain-containing protein [Thalassoporum mexicanum PCC 7367]|uniref:transglutaminase-like domain-containing protein n=1 Tax=Thalassoporum mexicanum TaxID=3457544 RepID=UPI00029FA338|nr:transglutaminase-like domain-containing protein [Pseudanabaena sp. PCC 7367]AFY69554.1 transglutaminase domain-containing protein [Pseudanabaena sp. PCC 7367]